MPERPKFDRAADENLTKRHLDLTKLLLFK